MYTNSPKILLQGINLHLPTAVELFRHLLLFTNRGPPSCPAMMWTECNPILPGFNPDPSIVRVGSDYFCTTSSFEYFPGLPIYHSTDLVNWTLVGHALNRSSQLQMRTVEPGGGVYAPSLRYWKGRFYVSTCVLYLRSRVGIVPLNLCRIARLGQRLMCQVPPMSHPRGFYVSTSNIWDDAAWSEPTYFDMAGIDQDVSG